jgi:hypothetical protein
MSAIAVVVIADIDLMLERPLNRDKRFPRVVYNVGVASLLLELYEVIRCTVIQKDLEEFERRQSVQEFRLENRVV